VERDLVTSPGPLQKKPYLADWGARPVNFARRSSKNASRINGARLENACSVDLLPCR